jgi:DNA-binding winged helix-turn-helix (wHTH) protein
LLVANAKAQGRTFRFGVFEVDEQTGELRREGKAQPRIRDQALRILIVLLERPQDLVTREELRERLWAADTFVDFDHGLNTAINQLRSALGDVAANPRFIQTLPRRGYRFIAPVSVIGEGAEKEGGTEGSAEQKGEQRRSVVLSDERDLPAASSGLVRTLFGLIQVMYLVFYVVSLARLSKVIEILAELGSLARVVLVVLIITAAAGIPMRLYMFSAAAFNYRGLRQKFAKLFPFVLAIDLIWAVAPFLLVHQIGIGFAIAATAMLLYVPFSQRSLLMMQSE